MPNKSTTPVNIVEVDPAVLDNINPNTKANPINRKSEPLAANTTEEQQMVSAGQRRVNLIWEHTQALIAILVVFTAMFAAVWVVVVDRVIKVIPSDASLASAWTIIATSIGLVVGFYFSRTNHTATGGVGPKPQTSNKGTR